jgi:lipopolysaccharide heptosyltransferase II
MRRDPPLSPLIKGGNKETTSPSFLLIRFSSLGDILLLTPALRSLRQAYPDSRIDVLIRPRFRELLENNPHISHLVFLEDPADSHTLKQLQNELHGRYDTVVDLHTGLRSSQLRTQLDAGRILVYDKRRFVRWLLVAFKINLYGREFSVPEAYLEALKPLGVKDAGGGLEWPGALARREEFLQVAILAQAPDPKPIALCPGASFATKRWTQESWLDLARLLLDKGHTLWVFGGTEDAEAGEALKAVNPERMSTFCGKLSPALSGAGLSFCQAAVTNDAGPMHMAAAVGTPVVAIFGSTVPAFGFRPFRVPHRIAESSVYCRPCSHLGWAACPLGHFRCMKEQKAEGVVRLVEELLTTDEHR